MTGLIVTLTHCDGCTLGNSNHAACTLRSQARRPNPSTSMGPSPQFHCKVSSIQQLMCLDKGMTSPSI